MCYSACVETRVQLWALSFTVGPGDRAQVCGDGAQVCTTGALPSEQSGWLKALF